MPPKRRHIFPHLEKSSSKQAGDAVRADISFDDSKSSSKTTIKQHPSVRKVKHTNVNKSTNDLSHSRNGNALHHLPPLPLIMTVLVCSGLFWISSFRDVMATGKPILDTLGFLWGQTDADINLLEYTKSTAWYDDSNGWKSKQGGLSTILPVTTDANNMGGLFMRKLAGVAGLAFHTSKIWPIVFHSSPVYNSGSGGKQQRGMVGASWSSGHYVPLLALGMLGDICVSLFYLLRLDEIKKAGAQGLGFAFVLASLVEAFIFGLYLTIQRVDRHTIDAHYSSPNNSVKPVAEYDALNDPLTLPSRIVARTVLIVSSLISVVSIRDFLFPGNILSFIPRDDIYLEWTGAFLHSPPPETVESDEHGLEAPLHAGDKFVSQLSGMYLSLCCMLKLASALAWLKGNKRMRGNVENVECSGIVSSRMIWKAQAFGNLLLLGILRLFTPAAKTASLDLRWHLMLVAYEMVILFLYGYW